eukprot:GHUV01035493.1.p1 GENE.GHUV01035493.1~~GHUV01035493.1.p1  ORF type:complete len:128 (-),score=8.38 GHUV01035493.1:592-975(-)
MWGVDAGQEPSVAGGVTSWVLGARWVLARSRIVLLQRVPASTNAQGFAASAQDVTTTVLCYRKDLHPVYLSTYSYRCHWPSGFPMVWHTLLVAVIQPVQVSCKQHFSCIYVTLMLSDLQPSFPLHSW